MDAKRAQREKRNLNCKNLEKTRKERKRVIMKQ